MSGTDGGGFGGGAGAEVGADVSADVGTGADPSSAGFGACSGDADGQCLTCGDVAVPLTVVALAGADARCRDEAGRTETVAVELVGPVGVGDRLLVHAGVALEMLPPAAPGSAAGPEARPATEA